MVTKSMSYAYLTLSLALRTARMYSINVRFFIAWKICFRDGREEDNLVNNTFFFFLYIIFIYNFLFLGFLCLTYIFLFITALSPEAHFYKKIFTKLSTIEQLYSVLLEGPVHRKHSVVWSTINF